MNGLVKAVLVTGVIYAVGSFVCSTWNPMEWHWIMKVVSVFWAIGEYGAIERENR